MLKFYNYDIVCQEVPDEITLAINITGCPNNCNGCHSPWLREDKGEPLTENSLRVMLEAYISAVTCVCFMGGDGAPKYVEELSRYIKKNYPKIKTAWYSGSAEIPDGVSATSFDYIKIGPYLHHRGGLSSAATNQRMWRVEPDGTMVDITALFRK